MKSVVAITAGSLMFLLVPKVTNAQQGNVSAIDPDLSAAGSSAGVSAIPPLPRGRSTVLGGAIHDVDPVFDRFTLNIAGEKPLRILFDGRTEIFVDGKRIPLRDLKPVEHASVQTTLDGSSVFAVTVHILSHLDQSDYSGQVLSFNPSTGDLDLVSGQGGQPFRVHVSGETRISRTGQNSFTSGRASIADLQKGSILSAQFKANGKGRAEATEITVLATPGAQFIFSGNVIALDMYSGTMMLLDPRNNQSYPIAFTPDSFPSLRKIQNGQRLRVSAQYDGTRYLAREVTPY
jgi:hypothetical protein